MDYFFFGIAMLFLGAFLMQFGALDSGSNSQTAQADRPLYYPGNHATETVGTDGNGALHIAGGDMATGGAGADNFLLDNPLDSGTTAQVSDFDPDEDVISVIYTPQTDPDSGAPVEPDISVVASDDGTAGIVTLNGVQIARIAGGQALTAADIALIAEDA